MSVFYARLLDFLYLLRYMLGNNWHHKGVTGWFFILFKLWLSWLSVYRNVEVLLIQHMYLAHSSIIVIVKLVYQFKAAHIDIAVLVNGKKGININTTVRHLIFSVEPCPQLCWSWQELMEPLWRIPKCVSVCQVCLTVRGAVALPLPVFRGLP